MKITLDNTTLDLTPVGKSYRATLGEETVEVEILPAEGGRLDLLENPGGGLLACLVLPLS